MSTVVSASWNRVRIDTAAEYVLWVNGLVPEEMVPLLGGLEIGLGNTDRTVLTGTFTDQAALLGVLKTLIHAGHALRSVECLGPLNDVEPEADDARG